MSHRAEFGHLLELILSAGANAAMTTEVPGAHDANPRFAPIVQKAVENALDGKARCLCLLAEIGG